MKETIDPAIQLEWTQKGSTGCEMILKLDGYHIYATRHYGTLRESIDECAKGIMEELVIKALP